MTKPVKLIVDEVIAAMIARPETFIMDRHTLDDKKTGFQYWIANTRFDAGVHRPFELNFGCWHSWRFHRALQALKAYHVVAVTRAASARTLAS